MPPALDLGLCDQPRHPVCQPYPQDRKKQSFPSGFRTTQPRFQLYDAEWLLGEWNGPAVIKGVVNPADAARAVQTGFNAISISNHGGRQLDASPAPIDMLRPIRDHIGDAAELIVDGGVRRSSDIIKAMALGANAVSFARPYLYGLAAGGQEGVERALDLFVEGLHRDMILAGAASIGDLNESFIRARS